MVVRQSVSQSCSSPRISFAVRNNDRDMRVELVYKSPEPVAERFDFRDSSSPQFGSTSCSMEFVFSSSSCELSCLIEEATLPLSQL